MTIPSTSWPSTLDEAIFNNLHDPHAPALTSFGTTLSYHELNDAVDDRVNNLTENGIQPAQPVLLVGANCLGMAIDKLALARMGSISVPVNPLIPGEQRDKHADFLGCRHQIIHPDPADDNPQQLALPDVHARESHTLVTRNYDAAIRFLPMTSGTTGHAQAVALAEAQIATNACQFAQACALDNSHVALAMLPATHIYGLTVLLLAPLTEGAHVIFEPFNPQRFISYHRSHDVTHSFIAPPLAAVYLQAARTIGKDSTHNDEPTDSDASARRDLFPALEVIVSGAAPLKRSDAEAVQNVTGARVAQGYGLTEASPVTHFTTDADLPLQGVGVTLADTTDRVVPLDFEPPHTVENNESFSPPEVQPGEVGELWVHGPQVMNGYAFDPESTAKALRPGGWLATGDLVTRDDSSAIIIVDRRKDVIKYHGFSVSPRRVEEELQRSSLVADAACARIFVDDQEYVGAFIVCPPHVAATAATARRIVEEVSDHVAAYEKPRRILFVDSIPRAVTGKVLRFLLTTDATLKAEQLIEV